MKLRIDMDGWRKMHLVVRKYSPDYTMGEDYESPGIECGNIGVTNSATVSRCW